MKKKIQMITYLRKTQLVHIEILCSFVVRYDDCDMVYF